jgi:ABC-type sugar transport system permease subunit
MNEVYTRAFVSGDNGAASAATVVLVLLVLVIVLIQFRMMSDKSGEQ